MAPRVKLVGELADMLEMEDDKGNRFSVPKAVARPGLEDRRGEYPRLQPRDKDSLTRGLPADDLEMQHYKERLQEIAAYRAGKGPFPGSSEARYGQIGFAGSPGDPAGLEQRREALLERDRRFEKYLVERAGRPESKLERSLREQYGPGGKPIPIDAEPWIPEAQQLSFEAEDVPSTAKPAPVRPHYAVGAGQPEYEVEIGEPEMRNRLIAYGEPITGGVASDYHPDTIKYSADPSGDVHLFDRYDVEIGEPQIRQAPPADPEKYGPKPAARVEQRQTAVNELRRKLGLI
jgi:hypothetical protein